VRRNDEVDVTRPWATTACLLSPGPGTPEQAGVCVELVRTAAGRVPVLGVCLGHQAIAVAYGAAVTRAPELLHGKTSAVEHDGTGVLAGCRRRSRRRATTRWLSTRPPSRPSWS
jgi:para-aminobenzoate synthetase component 2